MQRIEALATIGGGRWFTTAADRLHLLHGYRDVNLAKRYQKVAGLPPADLLPLAQRAVAAGNVDRQFWNKVREKLLVHLTALVQGSRPQSECAQSVVSDDSIVLVPVRGNEEYLVPATTTKNRHRHPYAPPLVAGSDRWTAWTRAEAVSLCSLLHRFESAKSPVEQRLAELLLDDATRSLPRYPLASIPTLAAVLAKAMGCHLDRNSVVLLFETRVADHLVGPSVVQEAKQLACSPLFLGYASALVNAFAIVDCAKQIVFEIVAALLVRHLARPTQSSRVTEEDSRPNYIDESVSCGEHLVRVLTSYAKFGFKHCGLLDAISTRLSARDVYFTEAQLIELEIGYRTLQHDSGSLHSLKYLRSRT